MKHCIWALVLSILSGGCSTEPVVQQSDFPLNDKDITSLKIDHSPGREIEFRIARNHGASPFFRSSGLFCDGRPIGIHINQSALITNEFHFRDGEVFKTTQYDFTGKQVAACEIKAGKPFQGSVWSIYWGLRGLKESTIVSFENGKAVHSVPYREESMERFIKTLGLLERADDSREAIAPAVPSPDITSVSDENNWRYTWSGEHLVKAVRRNLSFEAQYDALGRRVEKKVFVDGKLVKHQSFSYQGDNLTAIYDRLRSKEIPIAEFEWRRDNPPVPYAMNQNGKLYYYVINDADDVIALVDEEGKSQAQYAYGPFGETLTSSGPLSAENPFRSKCGFYDEETGLFLIGKRYYTPLTAKYIEPEKEK